MAGTQVRMVRVITTNTDPAKRYSITSTCIVPGTLTDTGIFVLNIPNPSDPKDDTFTRLITVQDVNDFLNDRDDAIQAGAAYWRSATSTLYFTDIETANAAWKELSSRITALVNSVDSYNTEFSTPPGGSVVTYPTTDTSDKDQLITAYEATAQPVEDAIAARDAKIIACNKIKDNITVTQDRLDEAESDLANYNALYPRTTLLSGNLLSIRAALVTNNGTVRTVNGTSSATIGEKDSIETVLLGNDSQLALFNTEVNNANNINTTVAGIVATLQSRVLQLRNSLLSWQSQYAVCTQEGTALQAAVAQTQLAQEAALADVVAVCPDFTP